MYENFENLPEDKRKRIIDACMEEFAQNGYYKASTNIIVKKAGISKGILFHYFGNKKNLYLYILEYIMKYLTDKFYRIDPNPSPDIFERLLARGLIKLRMAYDDPLMYEITFEAFMNTPDEIKDEVQQLYSKLYAENLSRFYKNIDTSKFRKDISVSKVIEVITMFLDGFTNKYISLYKKHHANEVLKQMDAHIEEAREYFEILKKGIYEE